MSAEIAEIAAEWAVRLDRPLTAVEAEDLTQWRASDPRCEGALMRARAFHLRFDRASALGDHYDPDKFEPAAQDAAVDIAPVRKLAPRRAVLFGGAAIAASLAGAGAVLLPARTGRRYAAPRGEVKLIALADGSRMTLNSASMIEVRYSERARDLKLVSGEALFDVAKNHDRPFTVDAGDVTVRAIGTSFSVRRLAGRPTEVVVREGVVEIVRTDARRATAAEAPAPLRLSANQRVTTGPGGAVAAEPLSPPDVQALLAWKDGMIAFKHTTLREAAAEFARYSDTAVVIEDPVLADERITGLYAAADPIGFAEAAAESLDLHTRVEAGAVQIFR